MTLSFIKRMGANNMKLVAEDTKRFYTIWWGLLYFVNQKRMLVEDLTKEVKIGALPLEKGAILRTELWKHPELIDSFVSTNPGNLSMRDLSVASSWSNRIEGKFILFRHLKKYSIFLGTDDPPRAFGVQGLASGLDEMFPYLPVLVEAVLLPFEEKLIYDSFLIPYNITFGGGMKSEFNESYRQAKSGEGIIASLSQVLQIANGLEILPIYKENQGRLI